MSGIRIQGSGFRHLGLHLPTIFGGVVPPNSGGYHLLFCRVWESQVGPKVSTFSRV